MRFSRLPAPVLCLLILFSAPAGPAEVLRPEAAETPPGAGRWTTASPGTYSAPANPWGGFFILTSGSLQVQARPGGPAATVQVVSGGRERSLAPFGPASLLPDEARPALDFGPLIQWHQTTVRGLELSFTLLPPSAPGPGPLLLEFAVSGEFAPWASAEQRTALLLGAEETQGWRWTLLSAQDASGRELGLGWVPAAQGLRLGIDDLGAEYPLTVSTLLSSPVWTSEGAQEYAFHGVWLAGAGDVDGDGFKDVLVGAYQHDAPELEEGRATLYRGSAQGLLPQPAWTGQGNQPGAFFGRRVTGAGDVNADGFADILVSATGYTDGEALEGKVFLYLGSPQGPGLLPAWTAEGNQAGAGFGISIAAAGDVNRDGFADVLAGAANWDGVQQDCGKALLYMGSAAGLALTPAWTFEGTQKDELLGLQVAGLGDVNGDQYPDVIVGAPQYSNGEIQEGRALLFLGSASGLSPSPAWTAEGQQAGALFGGAVAGAGDVNKDGLADAIIGARLFDGSLVDEGRAALYLGTSAGLAPSPAWSALGNQAGASFGVSVSGLGDTNADGYSDVLVGAFLYDGAQPDEGRAAVFLGHSGGLQGSAAFLIGSGQNNARLGFSTGNAGDVNGDGYADTLAGAHFFTENHTQEGRAYLFPGPLVAPAFGLKFPAGSARAPASPPPEFSWFPGDRVKFKVEWSGKSSFSGKVNSGSKSFTATTFTPGESLWKKIVAMGKKTGSVYWRVLGYDAKGKKATTAGRVLQVPN